MKATISWTRNTPSSAGGYSISITTTYSSFNPADIDEIEKRLPNGMIAMDTDEPQRMYPLGGSVGWE